MGKIKPQELTNDEFGLQTCNIGCGTYGTVYTTAKDYAVKVTRDTDTDINDNGIPYYCLREIVTLRHCKHPNIIKILACTITNKKWSFYMQKASHTLAEHDFKKDTLYHSDFYMYQLLRAVDYCHSNNIIHRDIKPQNILLFDNGNLKLADFGMAKPFTATGQSHTGEVCTLGWRAPEVLLGKTNYTTAIDVWSVGLIMMSIKLGKVASRSDSDTLNNIFKTLGTPTEQDWPGVTKLPNWTDFPLWKCPEKISPPIISKLLAWEPLRITAKEALQDSYFDSVRETVETTFPSRQGSLIANTNINYKMNPNWRSILFNWLWDVSIRYYEQSYHTLFIAFHIFDRYACKIDTEPLDIQGYGLVALLLATKLNEIHPMSFDEIIMFADYKIARLKEIEVDIITTLDYKLFCNPLDKLLQIIHPWADEKFFVHLTAMYCNYNWVQNWSPVKFVVTLLSYHNVNKEDSINNEMLATFFDNLDGEIGKKIKSL